MIELNPTSLRSNPALLKLDLYCKGMRLDDSCFIEEDGGRKIMRTRAGLGSGLEAILPGGLWTNIPVVESFAQRSPYELKRRDGLYELSRDGEFVATIRLSPRPSVRCRAAGGLDRRKVSWLSRSWPACSAALSAAPVP